VAGRWLHVAGYALGIGPNANGLLILRLTARSWGERAAGRLYRLTLAGLAALLVAEALALLAQTASLAPGRLLSPDATADVLASSAGRALAQRAGAALLLWVLLGALRQGAAGAGWAALLAGLGLALIDGRAGHEAADGPAGIGVAAVHLAAMGVWIGGLVSLLSVWRLPDMRERRGAIVARFGRVAAGSLALLMMSGVALAWWRLDATRPATLLDTGYARALALKLLFLAAAIVSAWRAVRVRGRQPERWWRIEAAALVGVLLFAALAVSLPPER
jgi:copper transport protein